MYRLGHLHSPELQKYVIDLPADCFGEDLDDKLDSMDWLLRNRLLSLKSEELVLYVLELSAERFRDKRRSLQCFVAGGGLQLLPYDYLRKYVLSLL